MFENLTVNESIVTVNGVSDNDDNLFIHVSDYGDAYFDIGLCKKDTDKILSGQGWYVIHLSNLENVINEIKSITGISEVKTEKIV